MLYAVQPVRYKEGHNPLITPGILFGGDTGFPRRKPLRYSDLARCCLLMSFSTSGLSRHLIHCPRDHMVTVSCHFRVSKALTAAIH